MRKNALLLAAAAAALLTAAPADAVSVCVPESPVADGCVSVSYYPGHFCVYANLSVAGVPVVSQPCR